LSAALFAQGARGSETPIREFGVWRSLVARKFWVLQVAGSNPAAPTRQIAWRLYSMKARIYRPSRSATQSGDACSKLWVLEFVSELPPEIDPLMGWTGSRDMRREIKLNFGTQEEAISYAEKNNLAYSIEPPKEERRKLISYSDNFKATRLDQWTH
jgi:NADH dehydrogenase ubiquinone Fe-S protein 4